MARPERSAAADRVSPLVSHTDRPEDAGEIYAIKHEAYGELATRAYGQWNDAFHREFTRGLVPFTHMIEVDGTTEPEPTVPCNIFC
jgi:hypothetical protein